MTTAATDTPYRFATPSALGSPSNMLPPSPPHKPPSRLYADTPVFEDVSTNDVVVGGQWVVLSKISEGSFGEVFEVRDIRTKRLYAIKREPRSSRFPQLGHESNLYNVLAGGPGIPQCHWHGTHDDFDCIVIDMLGTNLKQFRDAVREIPLETVIHITCQMVSTLQYVHQRGLVYRDVKPENFLFAQHCHLPESQDMTCTALFDQWGEQHRLAPKVHLVDFGLATWWRNPSTHKPYPQPKKPIRNNKIGTALYASLNVHQGKPHARRDDMESLGYMLLELLRGSLPWAGVQARNTKAGWDRIRQLKEQTSLEDLCAGLPPGFRAFIEHARSLRFADQPDYDLLQRVLRDSLPSSSSSSSSSFTPPTHRLASRQATPPSSLHHKRRPRSFSSSAVTTTTINSADSAANARHQDAFDMDPLARELAKVPTTQGRRRRANSQRRPHTSSRAQPHVAHGTPPLLPSLPSSQQHQERARHKNTAGWGLHARSGSGWATDGGKLETQLTRW